MMSAVREALRRAHGTRVRRLLLGLTLLLGAVGAAGVLAGGDRTFAAVSVVTHSLISVMLPFLGVMLTHDLRDSPELDLAPTLAASAVRAAVVGVAGVAISAVALALAGGGTWDHGWAIAGGGVLAQVVAGYVGTAMGLLIRPVTLACLATIVVPLGLYLVLPEAVRPWLAPYVTVQLLLSGEMTATAWAQWTVTALLWGVGLNSLGAWRLHREPQVT